MSMTTEIDYGTPASKATKEVTLTVDGVKVSVPEGTSIMRAAMELGNADPQALRHRHGGGVRLLPALPGRDRRPQRHARLVHDAVAEGMVVHTQTDRLKRLRKGVMELYISEHPLDCLTCSANGDCELQDMSGAVGLREVRYGYDGGRHPNPGIDDSNPYFTYEPSKCIVCSRCVRACEEVQGTFALTIAGRGFELRGVALAGAALPGVGMRVLRRLRAGLPDRDAEREKRDRDRHAVEIRGHHLRLLRRRLLVQRRDARRRAGAHGAQ